MSLISVLEYKDGEKENKRQSAAQLENTLLIN